MPSRQVSRRFVVLAASCALLVSSIAVAPGAQAATGAKNGLIAFVRGNDIWTMKPDGSKQKQVTKTGNNSQPAWSPDGKSIAFTSTRAGSSDIFVMKATGKSVRQVTVRSTYEASPSWSPDGKQLAFVSNRTGAGNVFVINSAEPYGNARQITNAGGVPDPGNIEECDYDNYYTSAWSPVDSTVLTAEYCGYNSYPGDWVLQRFNASTGAVVDDFVTLAYDATWAPKGDKIAFTDASNNDIEGQDFISRVAADGSGLVELTPSYTPGGDYVDTNSPTWSPDGTLIAYYSDLDGQTGMWTMRPDGANKHFVVAGVRPSSWQRG